MVPAHDHDLKHRLTCADCPVCSECRHRLTCLDCLMYAPIMGSDTSASTGGVHPVVWLWRTVPRWSADTDGADAGVEPSEATARKTAETALQHPNAVAAYVCPVALKHGQWTATGEPCIGLTTDDGSVKWYDRETETWYGKLRVVR